MSSKPQVGVLGLGNWGTALAQHLARKGCDVLAFTLDSAVADSINTKQNNPKYLSANSLSSNLSATTQIEKIVKYPVLLLSVPAAALTTLCKTFRPAPGAIIVSAIKGFEDSTVLTPLQYARQCWGDALMYSVLSGPSFAKDVIVEAPASLVVGASDPVVAKKVAELFATPNFRVYTSSDPLGVELGGAFKNVIALAVGICDGLGLGDSARAALITRGLAEMVRLSKAMGASSHTLHGLSGLGDLVMTSTCDASRNRTAGIKLGQGAKLDVILKDVASVVEGVHSAPLVLKLGVSFGVELPITDAVVKILRAELTPKEVVRTLLTRPIKDEAEHLW